MNRQAVVRGRALARVSSHVGALSDFDEGSWTDVHSYADRIDFYAKSLNNDARTQISITSDAEVKELEDLIAKAKAGGSIGELSLPALEKALAQAKASAAKRGSRIAADRAWAAQYQAFDTDWKAWYELVNSVSPGMPPSSAWGRNKTFEARLRKLATSFIALGDTTITNPLPASLEKSEGIPGSTLDKIAETVSTVLWVVGIGFALWIGIGYVFPLFVGAASNAKSAKRDYNEA